MVGVVARFADKEEAASLFTLATLLTFLQHV